MLVTRELDAKEEVVQNIIQQLDGLTYIDAILVLERVNLKIGSAAKISLPKVSSEQPDKPSNILSQGLRDYHAD